MNTNNTLSESRIIEKDRTVDFKIGTSGTRLCIVTDENSFRRLNKEWVTLVSCAKTPVYTSFDWLYYWWIHFGRHPNRKLFIVAIYFDDQLVGLAPFYKGLSVVGPAVIQRRLYLMGCGTDRNECFGFVNNYGYSDFLDVIAHPDYRRLVAESIVDMLQENLMHVDIVCFHHVADNSFVMREILPLLDIRNSGISIDKSDDIPYIALPETLNEYINQTGPSSRRRKLKKILNASGRNYTIESIDSPDQLSEALEHLIALHGNRWNDLGFPGTFYDRRHLKFVKDVVPVLARKYRLWFLIARDEQGVSAARMAICDGHAVYDWLSGYDKTSPAARFRPGLGLLAAMIDKAIRLKVPIIELLRGTERYKFEFTSRKRSVWQLTIHMNGDSPGRYSVVKKLLGLAAVAHYRMARELKLLRIQYYNVGILKMPFTYIAFRLKVIWR